MTTDAPERPDGHAGRWAALRDRGAALRDRASAFRTEHPVVFWGLVGPTAAVVLFVGILGAMFVSDYRSAVIPPVGDAAIAAPTVLLDVQGNELAKLDLTVVGEEVVADDLPDHVVHAVLAAEDQGFWGHGGVSLRGTIRAAWANLRNASIQQGASTITQQYVDLTSEGSGRSLREKMREVAAAMRLEDVLGKEEVLNRYLNIVPFGRNAIGIDQAARVYFRVPASELDVNQAATLAGMIAAPSAYDPVRNPEGATRRRDSVLDTMVDSGWLVRATADDVVAAMLPEVAEESLVQFGANAYVVDAVRRELEAELGAEGLGRGLVVHTTIDQRMQEAAQQTLLQHVQDQEYSGAIVTVDPANGEVRALVGGADFATEQFNSAVQARRQPGSSFKTFALATFVEEGYAPSRSRFDAPAKIEVESAGETIEVSNYGDQGYGELDVREATVNSVNTVYMQIGELVGPGDVVDTAHAMGVTSDLPEVPSIVLGSGAVSPLEMASAYATLPAHGIHHEPSMIRRVETTEGELLHEFESSSERALSEQTAGIVTAILEEAVERGTGTAAQLDRPVAGKTGTTDDGRDAWFVGFGAQLATSVWVGKLDNTPIEGATGGGLAAPIWRDYMQVAMAPLEVLPLPTADEDGLEALDEATSDPIPPPRRPDSPSPSESDSPSEVESDEPTEEPTPTDDPSPTENPSPTPTDDPSPTQSPSPTPTHHPTPTESTSPTA